VVLNLDAVGTTSDPMRRAWSHRDSLIYALGVGAGLLGAHERELEFTTENSFGIDQHVLPTFAAIIGQSVLKLGVLGDVNFAQMVHGDQRVWLSRPLPTSGEVSVVTTIDGIYDKGSGALVVLLTNAEDVHTGERLVTTRMGLFLRGAGGFGGLRGHEDDEEGALAASPVPARTPDHEVVYETRPDQALLYRLSGDRNPLHSDPTFAARAGFDRPILHGLCTYGFTGRALLHEVCSSDVAEFTSMRARFSRPTYPGDSLTISMWDTSSELAGSVRFQTRSQREDLVMDSGLFRSSNA
jgi:acyl dehydratase